MPHASTRLDEIDAGFLREKLDRSAAAIAALRDDAEAILACALEVADAVEAGHRIFTCGNGGSAAQAMHLVEELIGRYRANRRPLAAICLNADPTVLTCIANDFGFDHIFSRQVLALLQPGDVLVAFSTSGQSPNIVNALDAARQVGGLTVGLLGKGGGPAAALCKHAMVVEETATEHIQEAHQVVLHLLLEVIEAALLERS